jgi:hypothetical protein
MLGFPPKPTSILPYPDLFNPFDWVVQPKYRGWRVVVHNNQVFTRKGNLLPITTHYPLSPKFDYQLDGEIINPNRQTEHGVRTAIKNGTWYRTNRYISSVCAKYEAARSLEIYGKEARNFLNALWLR